MRRSRCPDLRAAWLLAGLLAGHAAAQESAASASPCAADPVFVETTINGEARGGGLALLPPGAVWVESRLLRPSESAYAVAQASCDLGAFVQLSGTLDLSFDPSELTLTVRPQLALLPGNTLDLADWHASAPGPDATLPLVTLGVQGRLERTPGTEGLSRELGVQAGAQSGPLTGAVGLSVRAQGAADPQVEAQLGAAYRVSPHLTVTAQAYAQRVNGDTRLNDQRISGVRVTWGDARAYRLPLWSLALPLDAEVRLRVNGDDLPPVRVRAGQLVLRNVGVNAPAGTLQAVIVDATGERTESRVYGPGDVLVTAHALAVQAEAGVKGRAGAATLNGVYGVTDHWSLSGEAQWQLGDWQGQLGARYADLSYSAGVNLAYRSARPQDTALTGDVTLLRDEWRLSGAARLVPLNLRASSVSASAGWAGSGSGTTVSVTAQATPGEAQYAAGASVSRQVTPQLTAAARAQVAAEAGRLGWQAGLSVTWTPRDTLSVTGAALAQRNEPLSAGTFSAVTEARWQPAPGHTVTAAAQFSTLPQRSARLGYAYAGPVALTASLSTDGGWSASGRAGVAWVAGRAYLTPDDPGPGVLVRVGLPGVPLRVNGVRVVSDARGEALVLLPPGTQAVSVTPDFDALPVTVSVREERRDVTLAGQGAAVIDWRGNFEAFVWVRLLGADGAPLPYATLDVQGTRRTDDEGWALLPAFGAPLVAPVTLDGAAGPACQVTLTPGAESVRCAP